MSNSTMKVTFDNYLKWFWISAVIGVGISYSSLYLYHILLVGLFAFIIYKDKFKIKIHRLSTKYHYLFFYFFIWYALSLLWSLHPLFTLSYLFIIFCGISLTLSIIYYATDLEKLDRVFAVFKTILIIEIILSLFECLGIIRLPISPFSHIVEFFGRQRGTPMISTTGIFHVPTGFEWNPNNLAVTMNLILPFFLFHREKKIKYSGSIIIFAIILITSSRANILTFLLIVFVYLFIFSQRRVIIALLCGGLLIGFFLLFSYNFRDNFITKATEESYNALKSFLFTKSKFDDSIGLRQKYLANGFNQLKHTYFWGVGGGNSGDIEYHQNIPDANKISRVSIHNFWMEIMIDGGLVFAFLFYCWYTLLMIETRGIFIKTKIPNLKYYASSTFVSLFGLIPGAVSTSSIIYDFPIWILLGFAISTINVYYKMNYEGTVLS